jgi:selenide, water dikinase
LPKRSDPNVLVGTETGDDAAVYRLNPDLAVVETLDFFTPVVDDPYDFGRVAAANAFSDVYAMGGRPIFALNIMAFPMKTLGPDAFRRVLEGGQSIAAEAGVSVLGGHSIDDPEPKYGMVVTGLVHPDRVLRNVGARAGDVLFLTKPLGSGVLTTAIKRGELDASEQRDVIEVMTHLNRGASEAMQSVGARAATDVTGFGLFGHLLGMVRGTGVGVVVRASSVPLLPRVAEFVARGVCPGGTKKNLAYFGASCDFDPSLSENERLALADAQTSGGLLIACPPERADELASRLDAAGAPAAARIGEFTATGPARIRVTR